MMRWRSIALALAAGVLVTSCGIGGDASPRDIPQADQRDIGGVLDLVGAVATGTARIYLLAPTGSGRSSTLQPVARNVPELPATVLAALFSGPNADELSKQFRTALPVDTHLLSARSQGTTLRVDVSKELLRLTGDDLVDALAQIVFTASELDQVRSVQILVEGVGQQWPAGNGELQTAPLTVYDFPGREATSQPAYPAFPTPNQP
jgi:spore germination protein GerM